MILSAYELRLRRAQALVEAGAVIPLLNGEFRVRSQSDRFKEYIVSVRVDKELGQVLETHCDCPDWQTMNLALWEYPMSPGISHVHYCPACKHVLAVLLMLNVIETPEQIEARRHIRAQMIPATA